MYHHSWQDTTRHHLQIHLIPSALVSVLHRRDLRHCSGSTTNTRLSRCSKASGESGSTSAPRRRPPAPASSCTSPSSMAGSSNSTLPKWVWREGVWEGQVGGAHLRKTSSKLCHILQHLHTVQYPHRQRQTVYVCCVFASLYWTSLPQPTKLPVEPHQSHDCTHEHITSWFLLCHTGVASFHSFCDVWCLQMQHQRRVSFHWWTPLDKTLKYLCGTCLSNYHSSHCKTQCHLVCW